MRNKKNAAEFLRFYFLKVLMRTNRSRTSIGALSVQAMSLVEEETRRYRPTKNYLEFLQPPKTSFEVRISSGAPVL